MGGHSSTFFRFVVWLVLCTFFLPMLPVHAAPSPSSGDAQPWNRHVHERLNSPERKAAIAEAARKEAAGRAEFAQGETAAQQAPAAPAPSSPVIPAQAGIQSSSPVPGNAPGFPAFAGNDGAKSGGKHDSSRPQSVADSHRPQSVGEVLFNYGAAFMGVPGLTPQRDINAMPAGSGQPRRGADAFSGEPGFTPGAARSAIASGLQDVAPSVIYADEGLGFHQDGTVRRAGGSTDPASGPSDRGQRANAYMKSGLTGSTAYGAGNASGLSPYGASGQNSSGSGYASTIWEPGYDAATGMHWRGDPTRGGRISGFGANGSSRELSDFDPMSMALDRGLNYGAGFVNSMGEAAISGLVDGGRARLNFYLDREGYFAGEGDALLPFYDSARTTVFTQIGARSMSAEDTQDRWIGNFGLGQRWFFALGSAAADRHSREGGNPDSSDFDPNFMLGYNAFFDYDFTRSHQRGGIGIEAQYDWLRLASNYYFPLSSWRGSYDFDSRFVKERPAEGWDARVKAYLPFYRNVAITGAYTQWYGDHVGMFGASDLEKDPKVWSYGLEYTPIPLVSGFITQKSTERGRTDTEFGLNFTYHFDMPWEQQTSHAKVAELRTVSGSRHEFVDRENRIILEYKAKNAYRIEYLGRVGSNTFKFRILDGFGKYKAGQTVRVSAGGGVTLAEAPQPEKSFLAQAGEAIVDFFSVSTAQAADFSRTYTSDGNGEFIVRLDDVTATPVTVSIQAGNNTQSFTLAEAELSADLSLNVSYNRTSFVTADFSAMATITATAKDESGNSVPINDGDVTWTVESSSVTAAWWGNRSSGAMNGLKWGQSAISLSGTDAERMDMGGSGPGAGGTAPTGATAYLTDIVGSRTVTVKASIVIGGTTYSQTTTVTFGAGPLSVFASAPKGSYFWSDAATACNGIPGDLTTSGYQSSTKLPTQAQLQAVAGASNGGKQGAAHAAGWPKDGYGWFGYWTGEADGNGYTAGIVDLNDGFSHWDNATNDNPVAVCLP